MSLARGGATSQATGAASTQRRNRSSARRPLNLHAVLSSPTPLFTRACRHAVHLLRLTGWCTPQLRRASVARLVGSARPACSCAADATRRDRCAWGARECTCRRGPTRASWSVGTSTCPRGGGPRRGVPRAATVIALESARVQRARHSKLVLSRGRRAAKIAGAALRLSLGHGGRGGEIERATRARRTRGTRAESTTESVAWGARACGRIARAIAFACRSVSLFVRRRVMKTPSGGRGAATYRVSVDLVVLVAFRHPVC